MKTYIITKKRDGQSPKEVDEIYAFSFEDAIKHFKTMMTSNLYEQDNGVWEDECGNEIWGFNQDFTEFKEDVFTWKIHKPL